MTKRPGSNTIPTKLEVIACLKDDIDACRESYQESDGVIRDPEALHIIRCLEVALLLVRSKFPRVRRGR